MLTGGKRMTGNLRSGAGVPTVDIAKGSGHSLSPGKQLFPVSKVIPWARSEERSFRVSPEHSHGACRTNLVLSQSSGWKTLCLDLCCLFLPYWDKYIFYSEAPSLPDPIPNPKGKQFSSVSEGKNPNLKAIFFYLFEIFLEHF